MVDNSILEPLKLYDTVLKQKYADESAKYFDNLIKESHTDEPLNRATVKKYNKAKLEADEAKDKLGAVKGLKVFLTVLIVIALIVGVAFTLFCFEENPNLALCIPVAIGCVVLAISLIIVIVKVINKKIKERADLHLKLEEKAHALLNQCYDQTRSLCSMFDWNIPQKIVRLAAPLIQIDDYFDARKFDLLNSKYGFGDILDPDTSTEMVVSGTVVGNPFLIVRNLHRYDGSKTYQGSLLITWRERVTDSEGHTSYVTRSQTLIAHVTKPCPGYEHNTYLVYGNEAAPHLTFQRSPTGLKHPDEKDVDKFVRKREKDLEDYAEEAVKKNLKFTPMANTEFECLWGGWNRDHEVEYRLLFTALAQQSECELIKDNKYFGDDFYFEKRKCLNFVSSAHSQGADYDVDPLGFVHYDVDTIRANFMNKMTTYFENLFFDLAPLLAIPMYQQHKPLEYIYKDSYPTNFTSYENEVMANAMPGGFFKSPESVTPAILKSTKVEKSGKTDKVLITAHSYRTESRVEYVPTMGGDGRLHNVPVYWDEYIPLTNDRLMALKAYQTTRKGYNDSLQGLKNSIGPDVDIESQEMTFKRGLLGFLINQEYGEDDDSALEKAFGYDKQN